MVYVPEIGQAKKSNIAKASQMVINNTFIEPQPVMPRRYKAQLVTLQRY